MNAAVKLPDAYWLAASEQALRAAEEADCVLVPAEFLDLHPRFAPLEFSWGLRSVKRLAWCCSKDDVDRLAPYLHAAARDPLKCGWSNEVFVVGGNFAWSRAADALSRVHLTAWFERLDSYRNGEPARALRARPLLGASTGTKSAPGRRVLLVGASQMGNVGDDLIASVLGEMLGREGAEVFVCGPDIDPLHVAAFDAVVVGGGGLIYASREGANETQNLANYLTFAFIAEHLGIPAALIAVGDQDHAGGIERCAFTRAFTREALRRFERITTRDYETTEFLKRLGAPAVETGADPVLALQERARSAVKSSTVQPARIALAGELYSYRAIAEGLGDGEGPLAAEVRDSEFDLLVMSNDDVAHCERMQKALKRAGASGAIVDLRGRDFEALIFLFASYRAVITTRFHALILAGLANVPVAALDSLNGKKARLLRELNASGLLIEDSGTAVASLARALSGELARLPPHALRHAAGRCAVHSKAVSAIGGKGPRSGEIAPDEIAPTSAARTSAPHVESTPSLLDRSGAVRLSWAASVPATNGYANLGDSLSAVVVSALSGLAVRHTNFDEPGAKLVAVGSIGHAIRGGAAVVWGAGVSIRGGVLAENVKHTQYDVRAIRGPISAQHYRDFGIAVPAIYGDPVWLLPSIFDEPIEQKYELGVIPHIQDVEQPHPDAPARADSARYDVDPADAGGVVVINTWHEPTLEGLLAKLRLIRSCKRIVSQSFHGVVIAEAYGIPVLNFRNLPGAPSGVVRIDLNEPCSTDPRIWEFYAGGRRPYFHMYNQRRDERSDWERIVRSVDDLWRPFDYDPAPLIDAFPLPLAYDPLRTVAPSSAVLQSISF